MNILALDTCTEMCSAALLVDSQLFETAELTQRGHSEKILAMMDDLFAESGKTLADVDVIAFGRGPGSFTGVRVGVGVAQGIAFARNLPVAPISSLAAVAQAAIDQYQVDHIAVAMDARMGEVYAAHYIARDGLAMLHDTEQVCPPEQFKPVTTSSWFAAGNGWDVHKESLMASFNKQLASTDTAMFPLASAMIPLAKAMAERGQLIAAEKAVPVYLRDNVAKKKGEQ